VTVITPDHGHAVQALAAMQRGKHVYVEKPLTRTPWEARLLADAASKYKVATQMGNQGYSHEATRVAAEIIWSGEIGDVTEVHSFRGRASWPEGMQTLPATEKVPDTLDWDLWLGPAAFRPYTSGDEAYRKEYPNQFGFYLPFNWRGFYDFGSTLIGDWGIHQLGPANLALPAADRRRVRQAGRGTTPPSARRRGDQVGVAAREDAASRHLLVAYRTCHAAGMTVDRCARSGTGPRLNPGGGRGRGPAAGVARVPWAAPEDPGAPGAGRGRGPVTAGHGYNTVRRTKGARTSGRGEASAASGSRWAECRCPRMLTRSPGHQRDWCARCKARAGVLELRIAGPLHRWMVLGAARHARASCSGIRRRWNSQQQGPTST
jgi:hypothetical protein